MPKRILKLALAFCLIVAVATAATPAGRVSSGGPVRLSGIELPVAGVPSWPIIVGDKVETTLYPAVILLRGGERIAVDENSNVAVEGDSGQIKVRLLEGTLQYYLPLDSRVSVHAGDQQVSGPGSSQGEVSIHDGTTHDLFIPSRGGKITTGSPSLLTPDNSQAKCAGDKTLSLRSRKSPCVPPTVPPGPPR